MRERIEAAATILAGARRTGKLLDALPEVARPASLDEAHAIQDATATVLGDTIAGWKVAVTPDGALARGGILRSRMRSDGATVPATEVPLLGVESEIAFRLERDLPAREAAYAYDEVAAAVTALLGIEIVDSRFGNYPNAPFLDRVADFMSNGAYVRGADVARWRALDLATLDVELRIDGASVVRKVGGHVAKDPLLPLVALANDLRGDGGLSAGTLVTTGTYTGLHFAKPGQSIEAIFHGVGAVRLRFQDS
jgi:2-keto-4-pentenoate hydratase